jgi:type VI secretion system secreted protein VgrG
MPRSLPFRPAKLTARPVIRGTQTATVVGSEGAEIDPDQYGRVKVHFRWDPAASRGLNTSCWVRVAQFWAGRQWGAQFIPRVGDEVVVAFVEGDPNRPIIIGSVYNADNLPIYPLPKNKTQSGIKTHSSLNGKSSNYNELMFEDKSGQELIRLHAERDMTHHVENSLTQTVGSSAQSSGADVKQYGRSTTQVYGDTSLSVTDGDYSVSVGKGKASVVVNKTIEVTSSTDYIHVTSPKQINLNVDGNAIVDITPGQIKLSVGKSTFITMTDDTIHLEAANIKINGTSTAKIETPSLDCFGKDSNIHGATMKFQGTSNAKVISPEISVTGSTNVTITGGTTAEIALKGTAELKGSTMKVSSPGITTIGGSMVKVNC